MLSPHVDLTAVNGELDPAHLPGCDESQQVSIEIGVTHPSIVADHLRVRSANTSSQRSPTQDPEAPRKALPD
jgi:hypothetical protein